MDIKTILHDLNPTAERGTLEYAASATTARYEIGIRLTLPEARELLRALQTEAGWYGRFASELEAGLHRELHALTGEDS